MIMSHGESQTGAIDLELPLDPPEIDNSVDIVTDSDLDAMEKENKAMWT